MTTDGPEITSPEVVNGVRASARRPSIGPVSPDQAEVPAPAPTFVAWAAPLLTERGLRIGDDAPLVELVYLGALQLLAPLSALDLDRLPFGDLDFRRAPDIS